MGLGHNTDSLSIFNLLCSAQATERDKMIQAKKEAAERLERALKEAAERLERALKEAAERHTNSLNEDAERYLQERQTWLTILMAKR